MTLTWDQAKKEAIAAEKKSPGKFSLKKALKNASAMYKKQGGGDHSESHHSESHHSPLSVHKLAGGRRRRRRGTKKGTKKGSKKRHTRRNKRTHRKH